MASNVVDIALDKKTVYSVAYQLGHIADARRQQWHATGCCLQAWIGCAFVATGADIHIQRAIELEHLLRRTPLFLTRRRKQFYSINRGRGGHNKLMEAAIFGSHIF